MTSSPRRLSRTDTVEPAVRESMSSINAVLSLSLMILTQASSPRQVMRLATTAVPSIAPGHTGQAWHPSGSGDYYERAPDDISGALAGLTEPGRLHTGDSSGYWAFPLTSSLASEPVCLMIIGGEPLSEEETFLLAVLAQLCGTVIDKLELTAAEQTRSQAAAERDIAQARAAESAASEARLRGVLDAALDAVVSIDRRARVTYVNSAFEHIFGYRAEDVVGRELAEVVMPPWLRKAHRQGVDRYLTTGESSYLARRIELTAMRADGSEFPAEVTVTRTELTGEPAFTGYVRDITERQRAEQELMASRARLVTASDATRQRVTRDLHDGAQQRFVITLINLQLAEQYWESAPQRARELLRLALDDARHGLQDLREIAAGIHPAILAQRGLAVALDALADRLPVPVQLDVPDRRLPAPIEATVYFFCSEALTNVVKHADAGSACVRIELVKDRCLVEVRDDGIGGARPRSESSGLAGLRDRIGAFNGTMDITSPAAGGTVLQASIPLPRGPAAPA